MRGLRLHYYLWHRLRNTWQRLSEDERRCVRDINPEWVPPRPALDAALRPLRDNCSGEDFLFMHRRMIAFANRLLARCGDASYPRVEGWRRVPTPDDADFPVPEFPDSELEELKSVEYFECFISPWARRYTDPQYLGCVTLGQLGSDIEFTVHDDLHMRWAAPSAVGYRSAAAAGGVIGERWDSPAYDYLGDTYSSHVNPLFWSIHGWIDDRVEDWKRAHHIEGEIQWRGRWVGPAARGLGLQDVPRGAVAEEAASDEVDEELRRVDAVISASAASDFDGFFRPRPRMPP